MSPETKPGTSRETSRTLKTPATCRAISGSSRASISAAHPAPTPMRGPGRSGGVCSPRSWRSSASWCSSRSSGSRGPAVRPPTGEGGMPLIKADNAPVKMRPEQPGGMAVPHQDKLIYDRLKADTGNTETAAVERLLPPPENPLPRPEAPPPPEAIEEPSAADLPPAGFGRSGPADPQHAQFRTAGVVGSSGSATSSAAGSRRRRLRRRPWQPRVRRRRLLRRRRPRHPRHRPAPSPRRHRRPTQTAALPPPSAPPAASSGGGSFRLQIASVKSEDAARAEFQRLQKRYPEALGGLGVAYVRVDLGDKGIYLPCPGRTGG